MYTHISVANVVLSYLSFSYYIYKINSDTAEVKFVPPSASVEPGEVEGSEQKHRQC